MPRPKNDAFEKLDFKLIVENASIGNRKKYAAFCLYCQHVLKNTAATRLKSHRSVCKKNSSQNDSGSDVSDITLHDESDPESIPTSTVQSNARTTATKRSASATSNDFGSLNRHHKKRSTKDTNLIPNADNNDSVDSALPHPSTDIILDIDADVETNLYNTFPPEMPYRVLAVNNDDDRHTIDPQIPCESNSTNGNFSINQGISLGNSSSTEQGVQKLFPLFKSHEHSQSNESRTLEKQSHNDSRRDSLSMSSTSSSSLNTAGAKQSRSSSVSSLSSYSCMSSSSPLNDQRKKEKKQSNVNNFFDKISPKEKALIDSKLAEFFYGCNIPFRVVESDHFKSFLKALRPAYTPPTRKRVASTLLDEAYEKCISRDASIHPTEGVLLIDGWKNSSSNTKNVVTMLHNANAERKFVQAVDLSGESETGSRLAEIVKASRDVCKEKYNSDVYCVVSDNAKNMLKMGKDLTSDSDLGMWSNTCSSHTANLLAKDVLDDTLNTKVVAVLKEFKRTDNEKYLTEAGGTRVVLPGDTRWCSNRDAYISLLNNCEKMSELCLKNAAVKKNVKQDVKSYLVDEEFLKEVEESIQISDPICQLVNKAQHSSTTLGEIIELWLDLKCPDPKFEKCYTERKKMAITDVGLAAFMLDPKFFEDAPQKLTKEQYQIGKTFIIENLDADGLTSYATYLEKRGIFKMLFEKKCTDSPRTFWTLVGEEHPNLAKLGLKLSKIPASSAQLERVFSNWSFIHNPIRNRLSFDRSMKLVHVYYNLKIVDKNQCDDY